MEQKRKERQMAQIKIILEICLEILKYSSICCLKLKNFQSDEEGLSGKKSNSLCGHILARFCELICLYDLLYIV